MVNNKEKLNKMLVNFTVDPVVWDEFKLKCNANLMKYSSRLEYLIKKDIKKKGEKE